MRSISKFAGALLCSAALALPGAAAGPAEALFLLDLEGQRVDPLAEGTGLTVFLFTQSDCPISNRFAPEVRRLAEAFGGRGVTFWLVYPDPAETPEVIRGHLRAYDYPLRALRDPRHELVRRTGVRVTPEAALLDAAGRLLYRGRINDRFVDFGKMRAAATREDLRLALEAALAGEPIETPRTAAVGCYIADLAP